MNVQLTYILSQERVADLHRRAAHGRHARDAETSRGQARRAPVQPPERATGPPDPAVSPSRNVPGPVDAGARARGAVCSSPPRPTPWRSQTIRGYDFKPVGPDDRDRLAALFARLSPQSRYRRFLSPKSELTPQELSYFTDIDQVHHVAIAAVDDRDGSIVGVGRYVETAGQAGVAEIAFVVADDLQSMGIGTALATRTVELARANGVILLTARTLWENQPARALLRRLGFRARASLGHELEAQLELDGQNVRQLSAGRQPTTNGTWT